MISRDVSDEFLLFLIRQNNQEAYNMLFDRYKIFLKAFLKKYHSALRTFRVSIPTFEVDLLYVFFQAQDTYEYSSGYFYYYWKLLMTQAISQALEKERRYVCRSDEMIELDADSGMEFDSLSNHEVVTSDDNNIIHVNLNNEILGKISDVNDALLSPPEKCILAYFSNGYNFVEIAKIMGKTPSFVRKIYLVAVEKLKHKFTI